MSACPKHDTGGGPCYCCAAQPAMRRTRNAEFRRRIAQQVHQCSRWLKVQGFEILRVAGGFCQPRIIIKPGPLCGRLEGAVEAYERGPCGERRYRYAVRFGCLVEWEGGAA